MRLRSGFACVKASASAALKAALALFITVVALHVRGASASDSVSTYADREASAEGGVFAGAVNLTPDGSSYAALSAFSETSTVTCP